MKDKPMLKVTHIASILEVTVRQVHNYIQDGHLKAEKIDGVYLIKKEDFDDFMDTYFPNRHKLKGMAAVPSLEAYQTLERFVYDAGDEDLEYSKFFNRYKDINKLIPPLELFIMFKRNKQINIDKDKGMSYKELADKYGLSVSSIKNIVKKTRKEDFT